MNRNKNTDNFGAKGTPVAMLAGSGVVINSNDDIEIFDNDIADNKTANIIASSVYSTGYKDDKASGEFDPYPERIHVHGTRWSGGGDSPDRLDFKTLKVAMYGLNGSFPDVLFDGYAHLRARKARRSACGDVSGVLNADGLPAQQEPEQGRQAPTPAACRRCLPSTSSAVDGAPPVRDRRRPGRGVARAPAPVHFFAGQHRDACAAAGVPAAAGRNGGSGHLARSARPADLQRHRRQRRGARSTAST